MATTIASAQRARNSSVFGTTPLERLVELCLASGYLEKERALSLIIVADPGSGKTDIFAQYREWPGVLYTQFMTFAKLLVAYGPQIKTGQYTHIVMPDFAAACSGPKDIVMRELASWAMLVEEGIARWETMRISVDFGAPVRLGLITGMTTEDYGHIQAVGHSGFMGRFLRSRFTYSEASRRAVLRYVAKQTYHTNSPLKSKKLFRAAVQGNPEVFGLLWEQGITDKITDRHGDTYGFRAQKQLQTLMMANALLEGHPKVTYDDLEAVLSLVPFLSPTKSQEV